MPGLVEVTPLGGKLARAHACAPLFRGGNVFHPAQSLGPSFAWVQEHEAELTLFPNAKHDDSVDATTQFLNYFSAHTLGGILGAASAAVAKDKAIS